MKRLLLSAVLLFVALGAGCARPSDASGVGGQRRARTPADENARGAATPKPQPAAREARDYEAHVAGLRRRLPSREFAVVVEPPFVVVGDGGRAAVEASARDTVKWAVDLLKRDFFDRDPKDIIDVWLFKDADSYGRHGAALFGPVPETPYGYYSPRHRALVMNISTGGGTLVHEIVHPFVEADFPGCPPWLNEGLGSLFEQSGERDGHIVGYPNWRLPGLQRAVRRGGLNPFRRLLAMDADAFYDDDRGTNYAQARYLCYYLQERGLLTRFYRDFRAGRAADPTGFDTLKRILDEPDMDAFQRRWEKFVLDLGGDRPPPAAP